MKFILFLSLILINTGNSFAAEEKHQSIKSVIHAFEQSIETKDKERFLNLFIDTSAPMFGVVSEKSMVARRAAVEKINREDNKNFVATRTWRVFPNEMIDRIVSEKVNSREKFSNIKIVSDGNIANVYFDYEFYKDNIKKHWGSESWQMVKTLEGWKISSVNYSITFMN
ncbi:hypothetical protein [Thalassotalea hakodatensis]|uniref:hypothetical protein n=1 Tax=Thalassotalea hakodatensis TaxID=3030492 RepID=UPI0025730FB6|nr:hypothetical protein [Thalassotalea hakodatensis]